MSKHCEDLARGVSESYEDLANAIIIQAAKDYRAALKRLKRHPDSKKEKAECGQIETFFCSRWYKQLTKVDGVKLMKKLQAEVASR